MKTPLISRILGPGSHLYLAIAVAATLQLNACGGSDSAAPASTPPPPGPTLVPSGQLSYPEQAQVFDRARNLFYALTGGKIIAISTVDGSQRILVDSFADLPSSASSSYLSLSSSGNSLYVAGLREQLLRVDLASGQIDRRITLPPANAPGLRGIVAVVASPVEDDTVYVAYFESITVDPSSPTVVNVWLTSVRGSTWATSKLADLLPAAVKPDATELLVRPNDGVTPVFRRVRIGPGDALQDTGVAQAFDSAVVAPLSYRKGNTLLIGSRVADATTLATLFEIPGAGACAPLTDLARVVCVGPTASRALFVFDIERRATVAAWAALPPGADSSVGPSTTGWLNEAGPGRVAVQYLYYVYKGFSRPEVFLYSNAMLN